MINKPRIDKSYVRLNLVITYVNFLFNVWYPHNEYVFSLNTIYMGKQTTPYHNDKQTKHCIQTTKSKIKLQKK